MRNGVNEDSQATQREDDKAQNQAVQVLAKSNRGRGQEKRNRGTKRGNNQAEADTRQSQHGRNSEKHKRRSGKPMKYDEILV